MPLQFLRTILPDSGNYCVVGINKSVVTTKFVQDTGALLAVAEAAGEGTDIYFALATYGTPSDGRKAANAVQLRSLFIDLDCGDGKPYPTIPDASAALKAFVCAHSLPRPYVVVSGGGLHAYWPFDAAVPVSDWAPVARRFKKFCLDNGLHIDRAVTADAARILRVPGTMNYKTLTPRPVSIVVTAAPTPFSWWEERLPASQAEILAAAKAHGADPFKVLAGADFPPTEFARIVRKSVKGTGCAQIAKAVEQAATLEEPLWRAALSIAWRCVDGETAIHKLSRQHPEYQPEATVQKAEGTKGPATCMWYKENYPDTCRGCQHRFTSPIQLGRKIQEDTPVGDSYVVSHTLNPDNDEDGPKFVQVNIPAYPKPYFRGVNGGVYRHVKGPDGEPAELTVYPYDLYLTGRFFDSSESGDGEGEIVAVHAHTPHDGIRKFFTPITQLLQKERMRDLLLKHGVVALNKELDNIMVYFAESIRALQRAYAADRTRNQMGWTTGERSFVIGELEYTPESVILAPASSATKVVAPLLVSKGSLEEWAKIANFYANPGMEGHALALFFGFGAPLLRLLGGIEVRGATLNLMSNKSGTGKTTIQMVINSIWGHPSQLLLKKDDTFASKIQWLGMMNNLPVTMDEITNIDDEALSELAYDIPQGRGRHRMESQSNKLRLNTVSWMTFVITSSNASMYDKLMRLKTTADGEVRRLIELRLNRPVEVSKQESDDIFRSLGGNYGVAGPIFISYVLNHIDEVRAVINSAQMAVDSAMKLDQSGRFHSAALACAMAAGKIANALGIINIPVAPVFRYAVTAMSHIQETVVEQVSSSDISATGALASFINENLNNLVVINTTLGATPEPPINTNWRAPIRLRYEPNVNRLWVHAHEFRMFCANHQIDTAEVISAWVRDGVMESPKAMNKRITAGLVGNLDTQPIRCYCLRATALGLTVDSVMSNEATIPPTDENP